MLRMILAVTLIALAGSARAEMVELGPAAPFAAPPLAPAAPVPEGPPAAAGPTNVELRADAERGDTAAMIRLGRRLETGRGGEFNEAAAATWYRRAADENDPRGAYHLGRLHATGRGVARNDADAMAWYTRAANGGVRPAVAAQAQMCFEGRAPGCAGDDGQSRVRAAMQRATAEDLNNMAWQLSWQTTVIGPLLEDAHEMAVAAVAAEPDNGYYAGTLGWIELRRAYYQRAVDLLRRERQLRNDCDWSCDDRLGDALHANGRTGEAREMWNRALGTVPGQVDRQVIQTKLRNTEPSAISRPVPQRARVAPPPPAQAAPAVQPQTPAIVPTPAPGARDVATRLQELRRLLDQGIISRAEYDIQRRRILSEI